jgi:hypothetical protein
MALGTRAAGWGRGGGYLLVPVSDGRISEASCEKIQIGWTREQVAEVLGRPWSVYIAYSWVDDVGNGILVTFDDGRVINKSFVASDLSFWEQVKRRVTTRLRALWP